jgi:hypothetical protein
MDMKHIGFPGVFAVSQDSGAGGTVTVPVLVPTGQIWVITGMCATHADIAARTVGFYLNEGAAQIELQVGVSIAANIRAYLDMSKYAEPFVCSPGGLTLTAIFSAVGANKACIVWASVRRFYGMYPIV